MCELYKVFKNICNVYGTFHCHLYPDSFYSLNKYLKE